MPRTAVKIVLTPEEAGALRRNVKSQKVERRLYLRSQIVLLSAEGHECTEIGRMLGISEKTCRKWRNRFAKERMAGLTDLQRPGAPECFSKEERFEILRMSCQPPPDIGKWTLAELTERVRQKYQKDISIETVRLILRGADAETMRAVQESLKE